ncbi:MAG: DNA methylase, partial [Chloroflexi bacterium]|nr:DNA methylase [Chloroflexota bacterium]
MSPRPSKKQLHEAIAIYQEQKALVSMAKLSRQEYLSFYEGHDAVVIEGKNIRLRGHQRPKLLQPTEFKTETTTLWSFPSRGRWATHRSDYRGNWAPQIARNVILRYSQPGERVLDQMAGGGTTLVECKLTGRDGVGVDINRDALMLTWDRLNFSGSLTEPLPPSQQELYHGDARNLHLLPLESIDLIAT